MGLSLALAQPLGGGGIAVPFDPLSTTPIAWYDPSDTSTMRQGNLVTDAAAAVDSPVGYLGDKSGNNYHLTQATLGSRPILRQSGAILWLEFDGVDDVLKNAAFSLPRPFVRSTALRQVTWTTGDCIWDGSASNLRTFAQNGTTPNLALFDGTLGASNSGAALGVSAVAHEVWPGTASTLQINTGTVSTGGPVGTATQATINLGAQFSGGFTNFNFYGAMMYPGSAVAAGSDAYLGAKAGR